MLIILLNMMVGLEQVSDEGAILKLVEETIAENPQSVIDYKNGKDKAIGIKVYGEDDLTPELLEKLL